MYLGIFIILAGSFFCHAEAYGHYNKPWPLPASSPPGCYPHTPFGHFACKGPTISTFNLTTSQFVTQLSIYEVNDLYFTMSYLGDVSRTISLSVLDTNLVQITYNTFHLLTSLRYLTIERNSKLVEIQPFRRGLKYVSLNNNARLTRVDSNLAYRAEPITGSNLAEAYACKLTFVHAYGPPPVPSFDQIQKEIETYQRFCKGGQVGCYSKRLNDPLEIYCQCQDGKFNGTSCVSHASCGPSSVQSSCNASPNCISRNLPAFIGFVGGPPSKEMRCTCPPGYQLNGPHCLDVPNITVYQFSSSATSISVTISTAMSPKLISHYCCIVTNGSSSSPSITRCANTPTVLVSGLQKNSMYTIVGFYNISYGTSSSKSSAWTGQTAAVPTV